MNFQIKHEESQGVCVLSTHGYMDKEAGKAFLKDVEGLIKKGKTVFLIDFTETPIVNSSGMSEVVETVSLTLSDERLSFGFCGLSPTCDFGFRAVGIQYYAKLFTTRSEGLAALAQK